MTERGFYSLNSTTTWCNWRSWLTKQSPPHIGRREISNMLAAICELLGLVELAIPAADRAVLAHMPAKGNNLA